MSVMYCMGPTTSRASSASLTQRVASTETIYLKYTVGGHLGIGGPIYKGF